MLASVLILFIFYATVSASPYSKLVEKSELRAIANERAYLSVALNYTGFATNELNEASTYTTDALDEFWSTTVQENLEIRQPRSLVPEKKLVMPLEADEGEALLLNIFNLCLRPEVDQFYNIFVVLMKTAISENMDVHLVIVEDDVQGCTNRLESSGVDVRKITWITDYYIDNIWIRDFGPKFIKHDTGSETTIGAVVGAYNREGDLEKFFPAHYMKNKFNMAFIMQINVRMEWGNMISNGKGKCITSNKLIGRQVIFRSSFNTRTEVSNILRQLGCDVLLFLINIDFRDPKGTGHVDMFLTWVDSETLLVGQYTMEQDPSAHIAMNENLEQLRPHARIVKIPMPSNCPIKNGVVPMSCSEERNRIWRTYVNAVQLGNSVVVPVYREESSNWLAAKAIWESVAGGRYRGRVVEAYSDSIISLKGAVHCITKVLPKGTLPVIQCPRKNNMICHDSGDCVKGKCICKTGYSGDDCSRDDSRLINDQLMTPIVLHKDEPNAFATNSGSRDDYPINTGRDCSPTTTKIGKGVWYRIDGGLRRHITLSTCNTLPRLESTALDTVITVFRAPQLANLTVGSSYPEDLVCIAFNDDDPSCESNQRSSRLTFLSESMYSYFIHVSGFRGSEGTFFLKSTGIYQSLRHYLVNPNKHFFDNYYFNPVHFNKRPN